MSGALDQIRVRAEDKAAQLRREAADLLGEALPGVRLEIEGDTVRLSGRQVAKRWDGVQGDLLLRSQLR